MIRSAPLMGTIVTIHVVDRDAPRRDAAETVERIERAFEWFRHVEACCSRFDPASELMQLNATTGVAVRASPLLFEAVRFAVAVADETSGAFDPTIGHDMEARGFNREDRSGRVVRAALNRDGGDGATYRDVCLDAETRTITLARPLVLDLSAVAKGLAIDMASRELNDFRNFAIDAGGDLYLGGRNPEGEAWAVGIRHPRRDHELIDAIHVSDCAVCTSGDYERRSPIDEGPHLMDPRTRLPATGAASATVVAPTAILADALATAAFVLGPVEGLRLLEQQGVDGLILSPTLERFATSGMSFRLEAPSTPEW